LFVLKIEKEKWVPSHQSPNALKILQKSRNRKKVFLVGVRLGGGAFGFIANCPNLLGESKLFKTNSEPIPNFDSKPNQQKVVALH